ncbi:VanW family protein [Patescibacteria group bacterium]|nr:VanW family protein [Patescibacteria group bacterium]
MAKKAEKTDKQKKQKPAIKFPWRGVAWTVSIVALLALSAELGILWLQRAYAQTIYPGVMIGSQKVAGQTYLETISQLEDFISEIEENGITFIADDTRVVVTPAALATSDPDLAVDILSFDAMTTVDQAYDYGRTGTFWEKLSEQVGGLLGDKPVDLIYQLNESAVSEILVENFTELEVPAVNAGLSVDEQGELEIISESDGERFDFELALIQTHQAITALTSPVEITLVRGPEQPMVTKDQLTALLPQAEEILEHAPFVLSIPDGEKEITRQELAGWLTSKRIDGQFNLGLSLEKAEGYLIALASEVDMLPKEGRFQINEGVVEELAAGRSGRAIDQGATLAAMEQAFIYNDKQIAETVIITTEPELTTDETGPLGKLELLGTGYSNFRGSPANRRHNIATGAAAVHGLVIRPGQEFSLVEALGPIEKETGYLPELVIKGNKTIPEYGGGLCQIGTTTFRAAMESALPVTERQNHSYNVSYYLENGLPGTDATIYPAHPDVRFVNDTEDYVLIQTRIEGNDLYFDYYGIPDGRRSERTTPKVWGWTDPPPTREVETTDLAPGERKCTESAHKGVKTEFTYTITYPDGTVEEKVFQSTYKPWQEVCLVGVEA